MRQLSLLAGLAFTGLWIVADTPSAKDLKGPLSPEQAKKHFRLAPGLTLQLVASEPQIESPVAMAFDEDGRLWVVEMLDYPNGPESGKPPQGRIKILEDRNRDGHYEHSRIFAENLLFANGILPWSNGILVTAAPHILYLKDTDGDGKAEPAKVLEPQNKEGKLLLDTSQVLFEGFAAKNPQLRVSHPKLGLDGWVYVANGLRGGAAKRAGLKGAKPIPLSGRDFRFDLIEDRYEAITGMGQYGLSFDDWGHRFVCDNRHHLRHVVFPNSHLEHNPLLAVPKLVEDISVLDDGPLSSGGKIYPLSKNWTTSNLHTGRFTAACSVHIYRGDLLPKLYGSAFTCDPTGNLVHREILKPKGGTFEARPARKGVEFLATPDDWCRPVYLTHGPDGAMYMVDMYRAVIEHPQFMPTELKNRPDLLKGKDRGRIWRIVPEKYQYKPIRPTLSKAPTDRLVSLLNHPNGWWRETAQRLLLERQDRSCIKPLQELCMASKDPRGRAHALWLLHRFGALDEKVLLQILKDPSPGAREQAVKLAESYLGKSEAVQNQLLTMANDPHSQVRYQVALSLSGWKDDRRLPALATIATKAMDDPWTRWAVLTGVADQAGKLLTLMDKKGLPSDSGPGQQLVRQICKLVGARQDSEEIKSMLDHAFAESRENAAQWQLMVFDGMVQGFKQRGTTLSRFLKQIEKNEELKGRFAKLANLVIEKSKSGSHSDQIVSARLLGQISWKEAQKPLTRLLTESKDPAIQLAAIDALATHSSLEVSDLLMKDWSRYTPALRRAVTDAMLRRTDRIQHLLRAIRAGRVKPGDLDTVRSRRLTGHRNQAIRETARQVLKSTLPADRKKVLANYQSALKLKGDAKRGRMVFEKNCATCHNVGGVGVNVGPVISDTRTKTPAGLMADILNPNQAIDNNYIGYVIETIQGRTLNGIITAETATSVTLQQAEDKTEVILRRDIEEMRSTGQSLMPEGLEKDINLQQMADLIAYLKNWRYLTGEIPLGQK